MSEWDDNEGDDDGGDDEQARSRRPIVIGAIAVLVLALVGVFAYRAMSSTDSPAASPSTLPAATTTTVSNVTTAGSSDRTDVNGASPVTEPTAGGATGTTSATQTTATTITPATTSTFSATTAPPPPPTDAATTVAPPPPPEAATTVPATLASVTYATLPDGTPAPIIVVYGADKVTLSGNVPDQASKDSLQALAIANSRTPVPAVNLLTIDPTVPRSIGVRVVELTSARFDEGSAKVAGVHAKELDRITAIMNALPNITVLIVGHADQVGTTAANYALSAQRAAAVVAYIVQSGINPARLSSRAVGDTDLLTLNDDAASLALNRRTEFIIYGLLGP